MDRQEGMGCATEADLSLVCLDSVRIWLFHIKPLFGFQFLRVLANPVTCSLEGSLHILGNCFIGAFLLCEKFLNTQNFNSHNGL